jgi:glycolate oxidase
MAKYNKVTPELVKELKAAVGDRFVYTDADKMEAYSHDETDKKVWAHMPEVVVVPANAQEISKVVKLANKYLVPITPAAAHSGLSGGAIPEIGGIVLSVERLNKILEIDHQNLMAVAEAGVVTNDLAKAVEAEGLLYAGYPMSLQTCMVGGNIAENAGGGKAVKYGCTSRYIMGMELVTPTGEIVELGGKLVKDVSGYNLCQLIVGSEGTLGIVTKAIIKLIGLPKAKSDLLVLFKSVQDAIDVVPIILTQGETPTSIEFMDKRSCEASCKYLNEHLPYEKCEAMLLIEVDGNNPEQIEKDIVQIGKFCEEHKAVEVYVAEDKNNIERVWNVRRNIAEAFNLSPYQSLEDIVVPVANIPKIMPTVKKLEQKYDMMIPTYGHAGDGNLHCTLIKKVYPDDPAKEKKSVEEWNKNEPACLADLYQACKDLGGKISGEHGIGIKRRAPLAKVTAPAEIAMCRAIKKGLDPNMIMNPGKVFAIE